MKTFCTSPLPFLGQKRKYVKEVKQLLNQTVPNGTYVDLFGGSGLLSHTVKRHHPTARVIYNDYDNFSLRIKNIDQTNLLINDIRELLKDTAIKTKIADPIKQKIIKRIQAEEAQGNYVDYVTLSSILLFTMNYEKTFEGFSKQTLYNRVPKKEYDAAGYLEGLEIECEDYKVLFNKYKNQDNTYFLIDPPYLSTEVGGYKENYWKLRDYLDVLNVLDDQRYLYFTSNKSQIIELCEWVETRQTKGNPFKFSQTTTMTNKSKNTTYQDILVYKLVK